MATGIYKFHVDCGRHGSLDGTFAATPEDIAFAVGHRLHFDEPWGKHSGVEVTLGEDAFTLVSDDPADVAMFTRLDLGHGECPFGPICTLLANGAIELTAEQLSAAPPRFRGAIEENEERHLSVAERIKRYTKKEG